MQENTKEIMSVHDLFCVFFMNQFHNISFFSILVQISLLKKPSPFLLHVPAHGPKDRFSKIMISYRLDGFNHAYVRLGKFWEV